MNQNRGDFSSVRVGAYCIRPTNRHIGGRTNRNHDGFSSARVGVYCIRPTNGHIGGRTDRNLGDFSSVRVGAYGIRPTNRHIGGRMNQNLGVFFARRLSGKVCFGGCELLLFVGKMKMGGVWVQIFLRNRERANQYVPLLFFDRAMGAYAIRPYPDGRKRGVFFVRRCAGKGWLGGDGLLLFVGRMKIGDVFLVSLSPFLVLTQEKETKESQAPAGGVFFVRCRSEMGCLGGCRLLLFVGDVKITGV